MNCLPTLIADCKDEGYERCVRCGYLFVPAESRERVCDNQSSPRQPLPQQSLIATGFKFVQAWVKLKASGKKLVSFDIILQRFRQCSSCEFYNDAEGKCTVCGCWINLLHGGQGLNKLEWPTESCPHKPPKWGPADDRAVGS